MSAPDTDLLARIERLERLEEQVFFQDQTINALNDALAGQQKQLDTLELRALRLEEKIRVLWEQAGDAGGETTLPPHYQYK